MMRVYLDGSSPNKMASMHIRFAQCIMVCACVLLFPVTSANANSTSTGLPLEINANCMIRPLDNKFVKYLDETYGVLMYEFVFKFTNYRVDPLSSGVSSYYKPWKWYRTRSLHGKTLLMLGFQYDILSMTILKIGVETMNVDLIDSPAGCFGNLTEDEQPIVLREHILNKFKNRRPTSIETFDFKEGIEIQTFVCHEVIIDRDGYADFVISCCIRDLSGKTVCTEENENPWVTLLYVCITLVKVMVFFCSPMLIPDHMYSASYVASEYVVKLHKELKMKLFVTDSPETSIRYRKRLTLEDIAEWHKFREKIQEFPQDEIIPITIPELRIKVKGKRIIPENDPPTGLMRMFYDNLIRCKIKSLDPFTDCCHRSVYASLEPQIKHVCTWVMCMQTLVKLLLLIILPIPFYVRVFIYYYFEKDELTLRRKSMSELGLKEVFDMYRGNFIQYLTPTNTVFICAYVCYFLSGFGIGFMSEILREKLQSIGRSALEDMRSVSRTSVLQVLISILIWPFSRWGLFACILAPCYIVVTAPACTVIFFLYCIPTIYLAYRLLYHSRKKLSHADGYQEPSAPKGRAKQKIRKMKKVLGNIDKNVHVGFASASEADSKAFPCTGGTGTLYAFRRFIIQSVVGLYLLLCLFAMVLLVVEAAGIMVEIFAFTMMGIIVNAGRTLRYVTMVLLVFVYMHDCYNNVYDTYLTFNKTVIDEMQDRVEDIKQIASLPSFMQENAAFRLKPVDAVDEIPTAFNFEHKEPRWRIGHLLLFLDSNDTPRIPLKLFKRLCEVRIHGAPGPVYINLLRATSKFLTIVVFLCFVTIVVMAFGNVHQMSSTNQTLATLAGGFVPMLLKHVLSSKSVKLNLKTISFKGQIDEIVCEFKQNWAIFDCVVEKDEPKPEEENDETKDANGQNDDEKGEKREKGGRDKKDEGEKKTGFTKEDYMKADAQAIRAERIRERDENGGGLKTNFLSPETSNGGPTSRGMMQRRMSRSYSIVDLENYADLFIDLSIPDEIGMPWALHNSSESLETSGSTSMMPVREFDYMSGEYPLPTIEVERV